MKSDAPNPIERALLSESSESQKEEDFSDDFIESSDSLSMCSREQSSEIRSISEYMLDDLESVVAQSEQNYMDSQKDISDSEDENLDNKPLQKQPAVQKSKFANRWKSNRLTLIVA